MNLHHDANQRLTNAQHFEHQIITYRLDSNDTIIYVNELWNPFALANNTADVTRDYVIGQSIFTFLENIEVSNIYSILMEKVRKTKTSVSFMYRCDSPDTRRFIRMTIQPYENDCLEFINLIEREEPREPVLLLGTLQPTSDQFILMCSWCKSIETPHGWVEIEKAIAEIGLFDKDEIPGISHGACPSCTKYLADKFGFDF